MAKGERIAYRCRACGDVDVMLAYPHQSDTEPVRSDPLGSDDSERKG
jgi:hypothetical protein